MLAYHLPFYQELYQRRLVVLRNPVVAGRRATALGSM
jgi:hypothetical protein